MSDEPSTDGQWIVLPPAEAPAPTFWPAGLAFGTALLLWGLITSPVLIAMGAAVFAVSLWGWIGDLRRG